MDGENALLKDGSLIVPGPVFMWERRGHTADDITPASPSIYYTTTINRGGPYQFPCLLPRFLVWALDWCPCAVV